MYRYNQSNVHSLLKIIENIFEDISVFMYSIFKSRILVCLQNLRYALGSINYREYILCNWISVAVVAQGLDYVVLLILLSAATGREDLVPRGLDSPWLSLCWNHLRPRSLGLAKNALLTSIPQTPPHLPNQKPTPQAKDPGLVIRHLSQKERRCVSVCYMCSILGLVVCQEQFLVITIP